MSSRSFRPESGFRALPVDHGAFPANAAGVSGSARVRGVSSGCHLCSLFLLLFLIKQNASPVTSHCAIQTHEQTRLSHVWGRETINY